MTMRRSADPDWEVNKLRRAMLDADLDSKALAAQAGVNVRCVQNLLSKWPALLVRRWNPRSPALLPCVGTSTATAKSRRPLPRFKRKQTSSVPRRRPCGPARHPCRRPRRRPMVVGYALTSRGWFQTIIDAIDDARLIAKRAGRGRITVKDLKSAIYEWRAHSDAVLQRVFDTKAEGRHRAPVSVPAPVEFPPDEPTVNEPLTVPSRGFQDCQKSPTGGRRVTHPEAESVLTG